MLPLHISKFIIFIYEEEVFATYITLKQVHLSGREKGDKLRREYQNFSFVFVFPRK